MPALWQYITGCVQRIRLHVRRIPIDSLPLVEEELQAWLLARYREKDLLLEHFYLTGAFPAEG